MPALIASPRVAGTRTRAGAALVVTVAVVAVVAVVPTVVVVPPPVPFDTFSRTVEPLSTCAPAGGFWETTWPTGFAEGTFLSEGLRPSLVKVVTAAPCVSPLTDGRVTGFTPVETLRMRVAP